MRLFNQIRPSLIMVIALFIFFKPQIIKTQSQNLQKQPLSEVVYQCLLNIVKAKKFSQFTSYFLIGSDGCLSCLERMPEIIAQSNSTRKQKICVILVGSDSSTARAKNIIHRGVPQFTCLTNEELNNFKKANNYQPFWYSIAIRKESNKIFSVLHHQPIDTTTKFLLKD